MSTIVRNAADRGVGANVLRWGLAIIVIAYLVLGVLYATATPAWQVPDEPAHYNYIKYVAERMQLPELQVGDFPAEYLEQIKSMRFPPFLSIDPIRYESHQPPLYYVLGAVVYRLGQGLLGDSLPIALRLFSMLIGAVTLVVGYRIVRCIYPEEPILALGTVAFAAFLPMHLAINAGINNDSLAELMLALVVWRLVTMDGTDPTSPLAAWTWRRTVGVGVLLGLTLLTKMQAYVAFGVALFALGRDAVAARRAGSRAAWSRALAHGGVMLGAALIVASPWLVRNMVLYGPTDPLAMARHDQVVVGQLTTQQFIYKYGMTRLLRDLVTTTFNSFWGQFGWMGVLLHDRIYILLKVLTALVGLGFVLYLLNLRGQPSVLSRQSRRGMALLLVWAIGTTLVYLWYNTKYVQHQGRYLFPALVPWGLAFTLGLRTILRRSPIPLLVAGGGVLVLLLGYWAIKGEPKEYFMAVTVAAAAAIATGHWLEHRRPGLAMGLAYVGLAGLALICLYAYIVPKLQPFI